PLDVTPRHARRLNVLQSGKIGTFVDRVIPQRGLQVGIVMAPGALPGVDRLHAQSDFLVTTAVAIHCDGNRDRALPLHALDMMLGDFEFVGGIELRPDRPAARAAIVSATEVDACVDRIMRWSPIFAARATPSSPSTLYALLPPVGAMM